ncbi:MAG: translation initiation factor Sui1 [Halieaceae bacterium]|nr:translation initiation factor Sui1 [Halieaceae bacterium]
MSNAKNTHSRLVYSTDTGRRCPQCQRPVAECVCGKDRPQSIGDGIVRLQRESKARGGKTVTVITGLNLSPSELKPLAKLLKQKCGVGGSVKDCNIEIQGDQRHLLQKELEKRGYTVKLAGG